MKNILVAFIAIISLNACTIKKLNSQQETKTINTLLDAWHNAAATADEDTFFNTFTHNSIYIGTDPGEHWKASELKEWSKKYFERESAWDFKPYDRHIFFSKDGKTAWFDELLKTWMGTCRGSGVLEYHNGEWKLAHYHLAIAVPNDKTQDYIKLLNN